MSRVVCFSAGRVSKEISLGYSNQNSQPVFVSSQLATFQTLQDDFRFWPHKNTDNLAVGLLGELNAERRTANTSSLWKQRLMMVHGMNESTDGLFGSS